ncbi:MAG: thiol-disulfide isomerase-like thioredoxin, partial [Verrucomicrobiales bacterium]|nr:thiol-disulfide isomerase-like thioredoxin [Verrucomicrobiales bacterium]
MSGNAVRIQILIAVSTFLFLTSLASAAAQGTGEATSALITKPSNQTNSAVLQLSDGSILHGAVARINAGSAVQWQHPASVEPLQFTITNIARIRFEQPVVPLKSDKSNCRFHFFNGDEITGSLTWMDNAKTGVETWFAGNLEAARSAVQSIEFSKRGFSILYEGPTGLEGWTTGHTARSWTYQDGTFMANGADILGRDFKLTGSSILEFDISWANSFSLSLSMYTSSTDRYDYNSSAYMFYLSPGMVSLQRIQAGAGVVLLGQNSIPSMMKKNRAHLEIRSSKEEASLTLL